MAGVVERVTRGRVLAVYAVVAAAIPAAFWPVRDVPRDWGCGEDEPAGQDAKVEAFQAGAIPLHAVGALLVLGALCAWSAHRNDGHLGGPTGIATALFSGWLAVMLAWNDAYLPLGFLALVSGVYFVGPALLLVITVLSVVRTRYRDRAVGALGWALVLIGLPLHLDLVLLQGGGPWFC